MRVFDLPEEGVVRAPGGEDGCRAEEGADVVGTVDAGWEGHCEGGSVAMVV